MPSGDAHSQRRPAGSAPTPCRCPATPRSTMLPRYQRIEIHDMPGGEQRADERADAGHRQHQPEAALAAPALVGQLGQGHAVVEGERRHDGHHDERDEQLRGRGGRTPAPRGPAGRRARPAAAACSSSRRSSEQRDEHGGERRAVEQEAPRRADGLDEHGGQRRAEDPRPRHHRRVQRRRRWRCRCGSTSSVTRPRRAGFSNALSTPSASVSAHTTGTRGPGRRGRGRRARGPARRAAPG